MLGLEPRMKAAQYLEGEEIEHFLIKVADVDCFQDRIEFLEPKVGYRQRSARVGVDQKKFCSRTENRPPG